MIALTHILVATDFGEAADAALIYGRALATTFGASLDVLHVVANPFLQATTADPQTIEAVALRQLNRRLTEEDRRRLNVRAVIEVSDCPADVIVEHARKAGTDLIVTGTHGRRGVPWLLLGSVAERIVRIAPCPVLSVRHPTGEFAGSGVPGEVTLMSLKHILVATDFGDAADAALTYGRTLAGRFGATLHVLHVVDTSYLNVVGADAYASITPDLQEQADEEARARLDERVIDSDGSGARARPPTRKALWRAAMPASAIIQYASDEGIDLIVMGTHGRRGVAHLLMGSVAERVVRTASCPVLTVHHPEHEFIIPDILSSVVAHV
jgi:nucleotide-binding universal stress UspA family protein